MKIEEIKLSLLNDNSETIISNLSKLDLNEVDSNGNNILHYFINNINVMKIAPEDFLNELDKMKFNYNARQEKKFKRTPIAFAVFKQEKNIFKLLIDRNVDIDLGDENGNPPLFDAILKYRNGDDGYFIKSLIDAGANPKQKNLHGVSPQKLAKTIANTNVSSLFK